MFQHRETPMLKLFQNLGDQFFKGAFGSHFHTEFFNSAVALKSGAHFGGFHAVVVAHAGNAVIEFGIGNSDVFHLGKLGKDETAAESHFGVGFGSSYARRVQL